LAKLCIVFNGSLIQTNSLIWAGQLGNTAVRISEVIISHNPKILEWLSQCKCITFDCGNSLGQNFPLIISKKIWGGYKHEHSIILQITVSCRPLQCCLECSNKLESSNEKRRWHILTLSPTGVYIVHTTSISFLNIYRTAVPYGINTPSLPFKVRYKSGILKVQGLTNKNIYRDYSMLLVSII